MQSGGINLIIPTIVSLATSNPAQPQTVHPAGSTFRGADEDAWRVESILQVENF